MHDLPAYKGMEVQEEVRRPIDHFRSSRESASYSESDHGSTGPGLKSVRDFELVGLVPLFVDRDSIQNS